MHRATILLLALVLLAACADRDAGNGAGTSGAAVAGDDDTSPDILGAWELAEGTADGTDLPLPAGATATLDVDADRLSGQSFCNRFFSTYRLDGDALTIEPLGSTMMACPPEIMIAESIFLTALGLVGTATREGGDLVLTGDGVRLRFTPSGS